MGETGTCCSQQQQSALLARTNAGEDQAHARCEAPQEEPRSPEASDDGESNGEPGGRRANRFQPGIPASFTKEQLAQLGELAQGC